MGGQAVFKLSCQLPADCARRSRVVYHVLAMTANRKLQPSGGSPATRHVNGAAHRRQSCCACLATHCCAFPQGVLLCCLCVARGAHWRHPTCTFVLCLRRGHKSGSWPEAAAQPQCDCDTAASSSMQPPPPRQQQQPVVSCHWLASHWRQPWQVRCAHPALQNPNNKAAVCVAPVSERVFVSAHPRPSFGCEFCSVWRVEALHLLQPSRFSICTFTYVTCLGSRCFGAPPAVL